VPIHPGHPVRGLTLQQVRDLCTGMVTNWNQVGGPNRPIVIISRDTNSGAHETFASMKRTGGCSDSWRTSYSVTRGVIRHRETGPGIGQVKARVTFSEDTGSE